MVKNLIMSMVFALMLAGCAGSGIIDSEGHTVKPIQEGDCVDRAIEIRQGLRAKGIKADIILGILKHPNGEEEGHAWIRYRDPRTGKEMTIKNY
jgi:hypothetical protein